METCAGQKNNRNWSFSRHFARTAQLGACGRQRKGIKIKVIEMFIAALLLAVKMGGTGMSSSKMLLKAIMGHAFHGALP